MRLVHLAVGVCLLSCTSGGDGSGGMDGSTLSDAASPNPDAEPTPRRDAGMACVECGPCIDGDMPNDFEQRMIAMAPDTWMQAPSSELRSVCVPDSVGVRGVVGCPAIVSAWSGATYDAGHRRMVVWGGGHNDYWGNELYAFDLRTGTWSRLTEPTVIPAGVSADDFLNQDPLPDGQPVSRHTYDGIEYIAHLDSLWGHGGSQALNGNSTSRTWLFDPSVGWSMGSDGPGGYSLASAYDGASRRVFVNTSESLHIYDLTADSWTEIAGFGMPPLWPRYAVGGDKTGAIDDSRGLFWSVGSGQILVWDMSAAMAVTDDWQTTGGGAYTNAERVSGRAGQLFEGGGGVVYNARAPGFDYDPNADAFVAWPNEGAPYALDLTTRTWSVGSSEGAPTSTNSGGTFGRWRYIAAYNVFVLINSVDEPVHFYKHTAGCGD